MQTPTNKIEIRKMQTKEIDAVVELWSAASVIAHSFISADYWDSNKQAMKEQYLPMSETYLAVQENEIVGFYKAKGFSVMSEEVDENTWESEFLMEWVAVKKEQASASALI